jgi:predicted component of type VI protein secretion system
VAKLIIYRGDTLEREIDLPERNARIGRGDQNDIVLADPGKAVSRFHAELRFEAGRFTIVDLNSQNGTWVAGRRVQRAVMDPGVSIVLGTHRIVLKAELPAPPPEAPTPQGSPPDSAGAGAPTPAVVHTSAAPKPASVPAARVRLAAPVEPVPTKRGPTWILVAGVIVLLVAIGAVVVWFTPLKQVINALVGGF